MGKFVTPYPPLEYKEDFLPNACWWRLALTKSDEDGFIYHITKNGDGKDDCTYLEIRWIGDEGVLLDAGLDKPNVACLYLVFIGLREYLDVLVEHKPGDNWHRITKSGQRKHPGMYTDTILEIGRIYETHI